MKKFFLIIYLILLCNCNNQKKNSNIEINKDLSKKEIINNWQSDKYGCLKIRNKVISENLINNYNLINKHISEFIKVFGQPNEEIKNNDTLILVYYFDSICNNNKIVTDGDKCFVEFYFENNLLKENTYICE